MSIGPLRFTNASSGSSDFVYPGPTIDMQSPASAGAVNGNTYLIYSQTLNMNQWEIATGAYTASSGTFARTTILANSLGTTAKISFSTPPQVFVIDQNGPRVTLTAATTYYVRSDGSDSNNGLSDSSSGAFLTIAHAMAVVAALDCSIYQLTVQIDAGTWPGVTLPAMLGSVPPIFTGIGSTTLFNATTCFVVYGKWIIQNLKVTGGIGIEAVATGGAQFSGVEFGACTAIHMVAFPLSSISPIGNYTISGGASYHYYVDVGIIAGNGNAVTVTITGTPAFSGSFALAINLGLIAPSYTFSGSATGVRYLVTSNAVINTAGAGANYFPGNSAGSASTGGQYL